MNSPLKTVILRVEDYFIGQIEYFKLFKHLKSVSRFKQGFLPHNKRDAPKPILDHLLLSIIENLI